MTDGNRRGHQIRLTEREAGVIYGVCAWAVQYMPDHKEQYRRYCSLWRERYTRMLERGRRYEQIRVTKCEAGVIAHALFWAAQYMPQYKDIVTTYYSRYARVYQVLTYKQLDYGYQGKLCNGNK